MRNIAIRLRLLAVGLELLLPGDAKVHTREINGNEIFAQSCARCHTSGDNRINTY
ncbi:MAG: hypothetical protein K2X81_16185 [Candidatus Obscuribacterales bacterium]|nr:hypothetical protein [Candidatus Obscuribacterales bacterium]